MKTKRIGVYSGTFNPVHAGHIAFALQAMKLAKLDSLYFLPERRPRNKHIVEHFAHRVAMLKQASRPYPKFHVLDFDDVSFTIRRTLPKLQSLFPDAQLVFLLGSDVVEHISDWPLANRLFKNSELVIGLREGQTMEGIQKLTDEWQEQPKGMMIIESYAPDVSSHSVREALRARKDGKGLLKSVAQYSDHHWLYVSLA
jgi:nicotinate-nucleotide adenylyltransferase